MLLLLAAEALARTPRTDRHATVGLGFGAGFVVGDVADAWGPGFGQRLSLGVTTARGISAVTLDVTHSYNAVANADALFAEAEPDADAVTGGRDTIALDLGYRGGFDLYGGERPGVRVIPFVRPGLGVAVIASELTLPSFAGHSILQSRVPSPVVSMGLGAEIRIGSVFSVSPGLTAGVYFAENLGEQGEKDTYGIEWIVLPAIDLAASF